MSSPPVNFPFFFSPPPPPPPPVQPIPSPDNNQGTTTIIVIFVSFGGILFIALLSATLYCFIKKMKKKRSAQEVEILSVDRHLKVKEAVEKDSHGNEEVAITIEGDEHVEEKNMKNEKIEKGCSHEMSDGIVSEASSSGSHHHHYLHHKV